MWCRQCQQDVPAVAATDEPDKICCARCGSPLSSGATVTAASQVGQAEGQASDTAATSSTAPPADAREPTADCDAETPDALPPIDDWRLQEDLQAIERVLRSLRASGLAPANSEGRTQAVHPPHAAVPNWHVRPTAQRDEKPRRKRKHWLASAVAWTLLSIGLAVCVCGAVLVGWSLIENRTELWHLGLPLALGGQAVLLIGLLIELETIWQTSSEANATLEELDQQLEDLRQATTLLGTTHSTAAQSFYLHMAEGASPEMLLADLKGQLDLLAMQIAKSKS